MTATFERLRAWLLAPASVADSPGDLARAVCPAGPAAPSPGLAGNPRARPGHNAIGTDPARLGRPSDSGGSDD